MNKLETVADVRTKITLARAVIRAVENAGGLEAYAKQQGVDVKELDLRHVREELAHLEYLLFQLTGEKPPPAVVKVKTATIHHEAKNL